eukprot:COSAG03_NODE_2032_length_3201_cov_3.153127_3_plen_122_part_00
MQCLISTLTAPTRSPRRIATVDTGVLPGATRRVGTRRCTRTAGGGYVLFRAVMSDGSSGWVVGDSRALTECECPIDKSRGLGNYAYRFSKDGQSPGAPDDDTKYGGWQGLWGLAIAANSGH